MPSAVSAAATLAAAIVARSKGGSSNAPSGPFHTSVSALLIQLVTAAMLVTFTMFFVWSCALSLGADGMDAAREANVPVLKAIAMLALVSKAIGDDAEYDRCRQMLSDADPDSVRNLLGD